MSAAALDEVARIVADGGDADDVLRAVVAALAAEPAVAWAGISFLDEGALVPGPAAGEPDPRRRVAVDVTYQGEPVGAIAMDGDVDAPFLARVASLVATHVLLGWDTGGESWEP